MRQQAEDTGDRQYVGGYHERMQTKFEREAIAAGYEVPLAMHRHEDRKKRRG